MPARDDFEMEHENEAEVLVSSIEAGPSLSASARMDTEDEELETSLKLAHVEMYQNKLKERDRRKQVSKNLTLVENFFKENPFNAMMGKLQVVTEILTTKCCNKFSRTKRKFSRIRTRFW